MGHSWQVIGPDRLCKWLVTEIGEAFASGEGSVWSWKAKRAVDSADQNWGTFPG